MAFDGTEGSQITLQDGAVMTASHRAANPNARLGHFMGKDILNQILAQAGCMGIRMSVSYTHLTLPTICSV